MTILDGRTVSETILKNLKEEIVAVPGAKPKVCFIRVGEDPASKSYVKRKQAVAGTVGIESEIRVFASDISQVELNQAIDQVNKDEAIHGLLIQAPLPDPIDEISTFNRVHALKDIDGFSAGSIGKLCQGDLNGFLPCTPHGIWELLKYHNIDTSGKHIVILGRSLIVGRPLSILLSQKADYANATVTVAHSRTENLEALCKGADILISAMGTPERITRKYIKEGATVIDVGINRVEDSSMSNGYRLVGDINFDQVKAVAGYLTPVPGGVGPMTVAMLMVNTWKAYLLQNP